MESPVEQLCIRDLTIEDSIADPSSPEILEESLPELLAPTTQEQESFFLTSTQVEPVVSIAIDSSETSESEADTTKKAPKIVETRRNKREHEHVPSSPSVASPARKIEKRGPVIDSRSKMDTSIGRVTRQATRGVPEVPSKSSRSKSKPEPTPTKTSKSGTQSKKAVVSIEPLTKRVSKPTEKAKAAVETNKNKKTIAVHETASTSAESPQRLSRTLDVPRTPTTPRTPVTRKAVSAMKATLAPEIIPETPPSSPRTRRQMPTTPKTPTTTTKAATASTTPTGRTPKAAKGNIESPDVIPGSPMALIGLRSLTKKSLRSQTPAKKNN